MIERVIESIPVTEDISVVLFEQSDADPFYYLSIKHNRPSIEMPGEVMISPSDTPALVKAITEAALKLTLFTGMNAGRA